MKGPGMDTGRGTDRGRPQMRRVNRVLIVIGSVLIVWVAAATILGATAGKALEYRDGRYVEASSGLNALQIIFLVVGVLLVLVGVVQHALDRKRDH